MTPEPNWTERFTPLRLALLIALLLFIEYPEVVLGTHSFFYRDFGLFTYPIAHFTRESFWRGEAPLWNPLNNCGVPFLAQWNTMVCYPFSWIYILLPLPWSLDLFCLGHLVLAGVTMQALAFRWTGNRFAASVAGLAFALNGLTLSSLMWTSTTAALAWFPLVVLWVEQAWRRGGRSIVLAAAAGAMQMLASTPEVILLTWLVLAMLWAGQTLQPEVPLKKLALRFIFVVALVFGLSAVQLLPFLEFLHHSQRNSGMSGADVWAMPAWGWLNFIVPLFRCSPSLLGVWSQNEQQWISSYYLGIGVVALAGIAAGQIKTRRVSLLTVLALAGGWLAMGDRGILYSLLKQVVPLAGMARYPVKFVVLTAFALPLLAAFAVNRLTGEPATHRVRRGFFSAGTILTAAIGMILVAAEILPRANEPAWLVFQNGAVRALFLVLILAAVFRLAKASDARRGRLGLGILLLLGFDVLTHTPRQNPTVANLAYGPLPPPMSALPRLGASRAMVSPAAQVWLGSAAVSDALADFTGRRRALFQNLNLLEDVPKVNGFFPLNLQANQEVMAQIYTPTNSPEGLLDYLGVAQVTSATNFFEWTLRQDFLPLITAGQKPIFADAGKTLAALAAANFNPRAEVYLPPEASDAVSYSNLGGVNVSDEKVSARRITAKIMAAAPVLVVVAQSYYPCWRAYVDGQPVRIWRANHAFQAVQIPAGSHELKLVYEDRQFHFGVAISVATLAGCGLFGVWPRRRAIISPPPW